MCPSGVGVCGTRVAEEGVRALVVHQCVFRGLPDHTIVKFYLRQTTDTAHAPHHTRGARPAGEPQGAQPGSAAPGGPSGTARPPASSSTRSGAGDRGPGRQCRAPGARRPRRPRTGGRREPGVSATACTRAPAPLVPLVAWLFRSRREAPVVTVKPFAGPASAPRPNPPSRAGQRSISAAPVPSGIAGSRLVTARSLPCCRLAPIPNPSAAAAPSVYAVGVRGRCARSVCAPGGKRAETQSATIKGPGASVQRAASSTLTVRSECAMSFAAYLLPERSPRIAQVAQCRYHLRPRPSDQCGHGRDQAPSPACEGHPSHSRDR